MDVALSPSVTTTFNPTLKFSIKPPKSCNLFPVTIKLNSNNNHHSSAIICAFNPHNLFFISSSSSYSSISTVSSSTTTCASSTTSTPFTTSSSTTSAHNRHWMVVMETPPQGLNSKPQIIDYYVNTLQSALGSEKDAQMCIYDASWNTHFGFCCDIDEETSHELAGLPGVLSVRPDLDFNSAKKDYGNSEVQSGSPLSTLSGSTLLFPVGKSKHWLVRMDKPAIGVVTKAQMVDYYTQLLTKFPKIGMKIFNSEKDAQMCIYHISWQSDFGFCCELDEECARELAGVPGVLSVQPDENFDSDNKNCGGENLQLSGNSPDSLAANETTNVKTKKLFVTGLSFYTSEKTLRAAFEGFGEIVEVKIIMDKISKRSKGYAFVEYTSEEAAGAALKEMNGKLMRLEDCIDIVMAIGSFLCSETRMHDTGNCPKSFAGSWKEPYGITFPGRPDGRFSDGRGKSGKKLLQFGINFAYGGTGVFNTLAKEPNMTTQINFFQQLLEEKVYTKHDLNSSIALVSLGGNDYATFMATNGSLQGIPTFTETVINQLALNLKRIHGLGVKRIAVTAMEPLGCLPVATASNSYRNCSETENSLTNFHNQILQQTVKKLNNGSGDQVFVIIDLHTAFLSALNLQQNHTGISEFENPLKPCCVGVDRGYSCGNVDQSGAKKYTVCDKPQLSFFWDMIHPSNQGWFAVYSALQSSLHLQLY
ncbi:hypothetical protein TEA_018981 [Camellia sinensis var. sinensis]|uniref:RRM domain-containing protein n=1 Tax=Camellia sinensis var. sinensis TaxID=542762 RepID=A0A4S4DPI2_CAMSN|nr:hypothetical protein TEA_018981 [Camellia sinensis var. sinensis]